MDDAATIQRIRSATVRDAPFAHTLIDGLLEPDLFQALRRNYPDPADMREVRARRASTRSYSDRRLSLNLTELTEVEDGETGMRPFARLLALLQSAAYIESFARLFAPTVKRELASARDVEITLQTTAEVIVDRTGFALLPHTDGNAKLGTALLYFADPGDPPEHGTRLYRPKNPRAGCMRGSHFYPVDLFDEVFTVPYRPNTAVMFARTAQSFHGVAASESPIPRRLLQVSIMLTPRQAPV